MRRLLLSCVKRGKRASSHGMPFRCYRISPPRPDDSPFLLHKGGFTIPMLNRFPPLMMQLKA